MVKKTLNKNDFVNHCKKNNILVPKVFDEKLKKYTISLIDSPIIVKPSQSKVGKKGISIALINTNEGRKTKSIEKIIKEKLNRGGTK